MVADRDGDDGDWRRTDFQGRVQRHQSWCPTRVPKFKWPLFDHMTVRGRATDMDALVMDPLLFFLSQ